MTDHDRDLSSSDDTQRLPEPPSPGSSHRYGSGNTEHHQFAFGQPPVDAGRPGPSPRTARARPGAGTVAALLTGALLVGGIGGLAGAAGFEAYNADSGSGPGSSSSATGSPVVDRGDPTPAADSPEGVARRVLPSVVKINVSTGQESGSGSGVVISSDGEILTNNHVVAIAGQGGRISVSFSDGTAKTATVVGTDPLTDLAVIKAQDVSGLTPATIGKSGQVDVGEAVVAIGSPFGLEATVTSGIVSALNRPVSVGAADRSGQSSQDTTYPAIQTDAAINPGNSGGPLVDMSGDVIGVNSSIRTASSGAQGQGGSIGLGFAIPIDQAWPVVQQLRAGETPTHARIGVSVTNASSDDGLLTGAGVEAVNPDSAGDRAGLERGDVITKVDDDVITGSEALIATIRGHRPGDEVTLTIVRSEKPQQVTVTLDSDEGSASS